MKVKLLLLLITVSTLCGQTQLEKLFNNHTGTMVIYDQQLESYTIVNEARAATRFTPWSTFKIPNSVIILETGIVADVDEIFKWDEAKYPREDWWPSFWDGDHNLKSGMKYSVVPLYRHLASLVGAEKMEHYLDTFGYGNHDISSGLDNFWLNGSLKISAMEQIEFLRRFHNNQLNVSSEICDAVKSILVQETTETYTLSYKTGAGTIDQETGLALGWLTGYVERQENVYYFALNIEAGSFKDVLEPRIEIAKSILLELGITQ